MPKFSTHVALMDPSYQPANFGPGDEVPEWAIDQVGSHVLEREDEGDPGEADGSDESGSQDQERDGDSSVEPGADDAGDEGADSNPPAEDQPDFTGAAPARRGRARKQ